MDIQYFATREKIFASPEVAYHSQSTKHIRKTNDNFFLKLNSPVCEDHHLDLPISPVKIRD